jgi:hypothetical protein
MFQSPNEEVNAYLAHYLTDHVNTIDILTIRQFFEYCCRKLQYRKRDINRILYTTMLDALTCQ